MTNPFERPVLRQEKEINILQKLHTADIPEEKNVQANTAWIVLFWYFDNSLHLVIFCQPFTTQLLTSNFEKSNYSPCPSEKFVLSGYFFSFLILYLKILSFLRWIIMTYTYHLFNWIGLSWIMAHPTYLAEVYCRATLQMLWKFLCLFSEQKVNHWHRVVENRTIYCQAQHKDLLLASQSPQ